MGGVAVVFVPYVDLEPETTACLAGLDRGVRLVRLTDTLYGYAEHFRRRWAEAATFVNVEHDMVFSPDRVDELLACPEPVCFVQHVHGLTDRLYLGLAKIDARAIAATPDLWERPDDPHRAETIRLSWGACAPYIDEALKGAGVVPHCHTPPIVNLYPK